MSGEQRARVGRDVPGEAEHNRRRAELRKIGKRRAAECRLQMTSMIDIVFLLIIFLILVTDLTQMEIEALELPFAVEAVPDEEPGRLIINVDERGRMTVWGQALDRDEILAHITSRAARGPQDEEGFPMLKVKIRADARVDYRHVLDVMTRCMKAGVWRVSFGARPVAEEEAENRW